MQQGEQKEYTQAGLNIFSGWAFFSKVNSNCQVPSLTDRCRKKFTDLNLKVMEKSSQICVKADQVVSAEIMNIKYFWILLLFILIYFVM